MVIFADGRPVKTNLRPNPSSVSSSGNSTNLEERGQNNYRNYVNARVRKYGRMLRPSARERQLLSRANIKNLPVLTTNRRLQHLSKNRRTRDSMNYQNNSVAPGPELLDRPRRRFGRVGASNLKKNRFHQSQNNNRMEDVTFTPKFRTNRKGFKGHQRGKPLNKEKLDQDLNSYFAKDPQMYKKMLDDQLEHMMEVSNQS